MRYIPVGIEEFSNNKLKHLGQVKQFLQEQIPVRTEAMEGYITIQGDAHISDKVSYMLEHAVHRVYFSGENQVVDSYREILERRGAEGLKVVVITMNFQMPEFICRTENRGRSASLWIRRRC